MKKSFIVLVVCLLGVVQISAHSISTKNQLSSQVKRRVLTAAQRNQLLIKAVHNPRALGQARRLLDRGADPCRALPFAVMSNNVEAVRVLSEYKNRCSWKRAVEERLQYTMKKDQVELFYALMADNRGITCPDPFDFTPNQHGSQWHPLSADMLSAVNQRCFVTSHGKADFLKDMLLLNPKKNNLFVLGENYKMGIPSKQVQQGWLNNIEQLVNSRIKVSNDTLQEVIAQSRVFNTYQGQSSVPFGTTLKLVKLCLKGGADGKTVLNRLEQEHNAWVWEQYSPQERMRLSNVLEDKPENQPRSFQDHLRGAVERVKNLF